MKLLTNNELRNINGGCLYHIFKYYKQIASFLLNLIQ